MIKHFLQRYVRLNSPRWMQEGAHYCYFGYRAAGDMFRMRPVRFRRFLRASQWFSLERLERYQLERLQYLVSYVYKNVPYYRDLFRKYNLVPDDFNALSDIRRIPILTREDIIDNSDKLLSRAIDGKYLQTKATSGSAGTPLKLYRDIREDYIHNAFSHRATSAAGARIYHRCVLLKLREFLERGMKEAYIYEPHMNRLFINPYRQNNDVWHEAILLIRKFKPVNIVASPSVMYDMACYTHKNNIDGITCKYFLSYFDNLFSYQRELIEKQFHCKAFSCYLCQERTISAFECVYQNGMHLDMERGILEVVGPDGERLPTGQSGRLITTGLYNFAFPLIRYEVGDTGTISSASCPCGRGLQLLQSLDGRSTQVIRYGNTVLNSAALAVIIGEFRNIRECQAVQEREGEVILKIVKRNEFSEEDAKNIEEKIRRVIGDGLTISIDFVDYIPRISMDKFPFIVSMVGRKD